MRSRLLFVVLLEIVVVCTATAGGTDLRGLVETRNNSSPVPGIEVALFIQKNGSFLPVRKAVTGPDGYYYFRGVEPGPYFLQVAGVNYNLNVKDQKEMQDIPVVYR
jgi:hypothetical protein